MPPFGVALALRAHGSKTDALMALRLRAHGSKKTLYAATATSILSVAFSLSGLMFPAVSVREKKTAKSQ